ncbi:TIGR01459 family HAD-type hydrolase [uncultured Sneathiella sp.]|uniref:TIGR01459 family HAD-type hydrolase n=1 Tax=uncultured Sneathiella sp. TaxID=879315 RepID=UPI0030DB12BF|tara:strand:- start:33395 stop:34309 length:915 start_codon:yes stop_codon:yes gene_type:complete
MPAPTVTSAEIFERYEKIRLRLPAAKFPHRSQFIDNLGAITDKIDVFLLDAFGVLNVGEQVIPGAVERLEMLADQGKQIFVLTNGATYNSNQAYQKYRKFGFSLKPHQVISSRDEALSALNDIPDHFTWGVAATDYSAIEELPNRTRLLADDPQAYDAVDGFLFLSSAQWTDKRQQLLSESLRRRPRPFLVGNPDLVAPREGGLTLEPGYFAHAIADETGIEPVFYGKPYAAVFERALRAVDLTGVDRSRIAMVGDTLHTDILGGAAAGLRTVLVTDHGLLKGMNASDLIQRSGIVPDFIAATT